MKRSKQLYILLGVLAVVGVVTFAVRAMKKSRSKSRSAAKWCWR